YTVILHFHIYLVFWCSTDHFASTATRKEQFARHEILRRQGSLRAPPQDDIVSFLKGAAPPSPLLCECEHSFLLIIFAYCYMLIFNIRLSVV
ncbi:MAG: hypothetical protein IJY97_02275, partial [Clostridia bacterium]|nr:hypothetical protein [Clostridia bacterium]